MITAEMLASEWLELFQTRTGKPINNAAFQARCDIIDNKYRELPAEEQEEFTRIIHQKTKQLLKPKERYHEHQETS